MTELRVEPYVVPGVDIGPENPLPFFRAAQMDMKLDVEANQIPEDDRPGLGWQTGFCVLPYRMQDSYTRHRKPKEFISVVLENEHLRVTVLPQVGGLVREIMHRASGKQLIAKNSVFQPGNLALRNAWVYGGIEWNTAQLGHHYLTMEPLHTARIKGINGEPALRMYAWDRVKCFPFQIDLHLPEDSPFLFVRIRIINPHDYTLPMYWWTNMGVDQREGRRVVAPAETAFKIAKLEEVPIIGGSDHSYPVNVDHSYDLFFRIPEQRRKWLAVVDADGTGLVHTSTSRLIGRKMFAWGTGPGGKHWQEHLCGHGQQFFEVQAGLARTQRHSVPMPAGQQWAWTEALGHLAADPGKVHGDWQIAWQEIDGILDDCLSATEVDRLDAEFAAVTRSKPEELLYRGLGWGALENLRAAKQGEKNGIPGELPFIDEEIGAEQSPWVELLQNGVLPERETDDDPGQYMIQDAWRSLLEASIEAGKGDHWLSWLHLGIMRLESGDADGARQAWNKSIAHRPSAWAYRNLASLALRNEKREDALTLLMQAWELGPKIMPLALEIVPVMNALEVWEQLRRFLNSLPDDLRRHERVVIEFAKQALRDDNLDELEKLLNREYESIREGETILTDLWFAMYERRVSKAEGVAVDDALKARIRREFPPPYRIDFRMWTKTEDKYTAPQAISED